MFFASVTVSAAVAFFITEKHFAKSV